MVNNKVGGLIDCGIKISYSDRVGYLVCVVRIVKSWLSIRWEILSCDIVWGDQ